MERLRTNVGLRHQTAKNCRKHLVMTSESIPKWATPTTQLRLSATIMNNWKVRCQSLIKIRAVRCRCWVTWPARTAISTISWTTTRIYSIRPWTRIELPSSILAPRPAISERYDCWSGSPLKEIIKSIILYSNYLIHNFLLACIKVKLFRKSTCQFVLSLIPIAFQIYLLN